MKTLIVIRIDGILSDDFVREYRKNVIEQMEEGLLIVDDKVKEVIMHKIDEDDELGFDFEKEGK